MTQRRDNPEALSNYFDRLTDGIGARGSSFMDIDSYVHDGRQARLYLTHDGKGADRFLVQEFKYQGQTVDLGQARALIAMAHQPAFTVWLIVKRDDGQIGFFNYLWERGRKVELLSEHDYQARFGSWWHCKDSGTELLQDSGISWQ
tara:strand:- start:2370 stop:2807 length:438 start_codon:yes stop_codon:yes gene_type:complete